MMTSFVFRLERFLKLRVHKERECAESLGAAVRAEEESRRQAEDRAAHVKTIVTRISEETTSAVSTAGALRNRGLALEAAVHQAASAEDSHRDAKKATDVERELWGKARVERRMIERLRERREGEWATSAARAEQKETDETAARVRPTRGWGT